LGVLSEVTLEYRYKALSSIEPFDYALSGAVEYSVDGEWHSSQFMNVTVHLSDGASWASLWVFDVALLWMFLCLAVFWAAMCVVFYEFWWIPNQEMKGHADADAGNVGNGLCAVH
jgi:hypothetical protein